MKIHNMELSKKESFLTNAFLKTPIFMTTRSNEFIETEYNMFNYNVQISGKQLNNDKDLDLFLWLVQQNKKTIVVAWKDILTDLGIINKDRRINKDRKNMLIKSVSKLMGTNINIKGKDMELNCSGGGFSLISDYEFDNDNIKIRVSDKLIELYAQEKFKKVIKLDDLENLSQNDRSLYLFICSYRKREVYIRLDKLKVRFAPDKLNKDYTKQLKISLNNLEAAGKIGCSYITKQNVLYINKKSLTQADCKKMCEEHAKENGGTTGKYEDVDTYEADEKIRLKQVAVKNAELIRQKEIEDSIPF